MKAVLTNEKNCSVCVAGSALETDKKINLAIKISVNVEVVEASRSTAQGRSVNGRGNGLYPASGLSLARPAGHLRILELCLYPLASLVSGGIMGQIAASVGPEGARPTALPGCQPYQGASGCQQSRWRPTKSSHWPHQGRSEYQAQRLGGRARTSDQSQSGGRTGRRGNHGASIGATGVEGNHHGCRQGIRQRRLSGTVAAMGKPPLHPAPFQSHSSSQLEPRPLSQTSQSRELIPTLKTLSPNRNKI
jgi:hypothetical protein